MSEGTLRCIADRYTDIKESGFNKGKKKIALASKV
jgi:hypothetical protein